MLENKELFNKLVAKYELGEMINNPTKLTGGLTHTMYKVETTKGNYVVKILNPNIMKRTTAIHNFNEADKIEEILKINLIPAIYSLEYDGKKMQKLDEQYFYIFNWYDGKSIKGEYIKEDHCKKIGEILSEIHNIDLKNEKYERNEINIDWAKYIELAKEKESPIYNILYDKIEILNDSMNKGNLAIKHVPNIVSICHNDMDSKNVLWINDEFKLIDLECLGYSNPYLELFELALCWSGYEECNINFDLFESFINSYFKNTKLEKNIDWETIYYSNYGRLKWLEFNIKRSLLIDCDTIEEQKIGLIEVKETIEHVVYYDKVKEEVLGNMNYEKI